MPLWNLHCNENAYSTEDKKSFSEAITSIYTSVGLPRFYVSVVFHDTYGFPVRRRRCAERLRAHLDRPHRPKHSA